jgi:cytochrome c6
MRHRALCVLTGLLCCASAHADDASGKGNYEKICAACHQPDGKGIPDAFPALAGNALVQGNPKAFAAVPLTGRDGMPNFSKRLDDATLAGILSYIRGAWGNKGAPISAAEIAALRAELHAEAFDATPDGNQH